MKRLKKWATLLAVAAFVMLVIPQWTLSVSAAEVSGGAGNGDIASGRDNNIEWVIDANGKLTISGSGDFSKNEYGYNIIPWDNYKNNIKSAVCSVTGMTNASKLFLDCRSMTSVDLSGFDTSHITNMGSMFSYCHGLESVDLSGFDTSSVTNMSGMFSWCTNLTSLDISGFDTSNVTDMQSMFYNCFGLQSLDISGFDTSNVTNMNSMFYGCKLKSLDVSKFNTSNVVDMKSMFEFCTVLQSLDVSNFDTSNVEYMFSMFSGCWKLSSLDLSGFDLSKVIGISSLFGACDNLSTIYAPLSLKDSITLPGTGWHLTDGTEITELPKNLSSSVMITRSVSGADEDDNKDEESDKSDNNSNGADKDNNNNNNQPGAVSGVLEGTGSTTDSAIYGTRLLTANPTDYKTILLSWDAVPNAKSYEIFYSTSPDTGFKRLANVKKTSYKFTKAKCGVTYYFQMRVCQKGKVKSEFGPISYGKTDLSSSAALQVKKTTYNSVTLKWSKVAGAKRYEIYYADSMDGDWLIIPGDQPMR